MRLSIHDQKQWKYVSIYAGEHEIINKKMKLAYLHDLADQVQTTEEVNDFHKEL